MICLLSIKQLNDTQYILRYGLLAPQFEVFSIRIETRCTYRPTTNRYEWYRLYSDNIFYEPEWMVNIFGQWLKQN